MRKRFVWWTALPALVALPAAAPAQASQSAPDAAAAADPLPPSPLPGSEQLIEFTADQVTYDSAAEVVIASGQVRMAREGNYVAADRIIWNRKTGEVRAEGNVVVLTPEGNRLVGESVDLTDTLRDGTVQNLLVVLESGGRIAAARGTRSGEMTVLENAVYSPCPVTSDTGCPRNPSWSITAARVIHDPVRGRVRFQGGRLQLFGVTLPLLPVFSIGSAGQETAFSGWLVPDLSISTRKGLEIATPYYWRMSPNRDATVTPHFYSGTNPALEGRYRQLNDLGAFQLGAFATFAEIEDPDPNVDSNRSGFRAYGEANGKFQFSPAWSLTASLRAATDKTVTRRYDITRDDRLRNVVNAERITYDSYISIAGWAFQGLRVDDVQRQIPIALPAIDARFRPDAPFLGGQVELQANSLSILRIDGQDTQRAFASGRWEMRRFTNMGQRLTFSAYGRGDVYHTNLSSRPEPVFYRGGNGWRVRGIGALAADAEWPLIGPLFGGTQRLTPRVQLVLTPPTPNLSIPNEDARAVDLEDSNLFSLNRFPGYDRWEDSSRVTYGVDWALERPNLTITSNVGQSYRLERQPSIFPQGTGLTDRLSDLVGRTRVRYGRLIDVTHRFRIDKDNLAVRRNELDLTVGTEQTYGQIGYLRLDRDVSAAVEDLRDKEELRIAGRVKFARYWSAFGATVLDLTDAEEDPLSLADGFEPVRNRLGIAYEDDCIDIGLSWRRDYERIGDFRKGSTFSFRLALKGLGR